MRSDTITKGFDRAPHRALLRAAAAFGDHRVGEDLKSTGRVLRSEPGQGCDEVVGEVGGGHGGP